MSASIVYIEDLGGKIAYSTFNVKEFIDS